MHKLCKIYLHEIFCRVKFHAFLQRLKGYFPLFQNVILYFCPFKRDTTIINSFSLYRCKNLLRYYRSLSIWWISYNFQIYLTLYCSVQLLLQTTAGNVLKFLLIKHNFCFSFKLSLRLKLRINITNAAWSFRYLRLKKLFSMKRKEYP